MRYNEDQRIETSVPFLQDRTILYVDSRTGTSHHYIEKNRERLAGSFGSLGYKFLYLPELAGSLHPAVLHYMLPGQDDTRLAENMYRRVQDMARLGGKTGFLYKQHGLTYFREIPESPEEGIMAAVNAFISFLYEDTFQKANKLPLRNERRSKDREDIMFRAEMKHEEDFGSMGIPEGISKASGSGIRHEARIREEPLDPRTQAILDEWEKLSNRFGITIEDLQAMLGYTVHLSRLVITTANRIYLADLEGKPEIKLDDLTKALYFFYLKHPEGAAFKELQSHEDEILHIYMGLTGRDNLTAIRNSVSSLVSPFSDGRNVCVSRIKRAFKNIVDERIAKYYYIDGKYAEKRAIGLDRDLVIWEH